ncbi:MAG TPA: radical SAM protein [Longilinea sp.]|nr:radical SAM protein [Longilinea sp.]
MKEITSSTFPCSTDPQLTQVYVEPTSQCNLDCRICVRKTWSEPTGFMGIDTFQNLIDGLRQMPSVKRVNFWGIGEPLLHPEIVSMVAQVNALGVETQIITNGLLLDQTKAEGFIQAGLDRLILSIDSVSPVSKLDSRCGDELKQALQNVAELRALTEERCSLSGISRGPCGQVEYNSTRKPNIGIAFVVTKSNLHELNQLRSLAASLGANLISLTNLLPYAEEMQEEILYSSTAGRNPPNDYSSRFPEISLPRLDVSPELFNVLPGLLGNGNSIGGSQPSLSRYANYCRFVEEGSIAVNWQGEVSPCVPLMHSYSCYVFGREKRFKSCSLGNLKTNALQKIWQSAEFLRIRDTVRRFPFAPCTDCGGCAQSETNEEDCYGNVFPVCGDCLWAKGVIQCP